MSNFEFFEHIGGTCGVTHTCSSSWVFWDELCHVPYLPVNDNPTICGSLVRSDLLGRKEFCIVHSGSNRVLYKTGGLGK
jgi:hypothetical protein